MSISLTVLGALQYHKKCYSIKTTSISIKIRYKSINQGKVWWNKYIKINININIDWNGVVKS